MSLQENVTRWLKNNEKIKKQNELLKELKIERNILEESIFDYANENDINNVSIKTNERTLNIFDLKTSSPLSFKYIQNCLNEIFDSDKVNEIITYLKEKRTYSVTKSIKKIE